MGARNQTAEVAIIGGGIMGAANGLDGLREDWLAVLHERRRPGKDREATRGRQADRPRGHVHNG